MCARTRSDVSAGSFQVPCSAVLVLVLVDKEKSREEKMKVPKISDSLPMLDDEDLPAERYEISLGSRVTRLDISCYEQSAVKWLAG